MIGPLERRGLAGLGAAPEVPGLPRHDCRHAGHARRLARVSDRIDRLGGRDDQHHVDLVGIDQRLRQLTGARRIGLGVAIEDVDPIGLVASLQARGQRLPGEFENIAVGLAEPAKLTGARADEADLKRRLGTGGESAVRAGGSREACGAGGHNQSAPRYRRVCETDDGGFGFHFVSSQAPSQPWRPARPKSLHVSGADRKAWAVRAFRSIDEGARGRSKSGGLASREAEIARA